MQPYFLFILLAYGISAAGLLGFALAAWRRRALARRLAREGV